MSPTIILAVVLAIIASGGGGFFYGGHVKEAELLAAQEKKDKATIVQHNEDTAIDMQAAYERGKQEAKIKVVTRTIQGEANAISASAPIPASCRLDASRFGMLQRAINVANGDADSAVGVPNGVPKNKPPGKPGA